MPASIRVKKFKTWNKITWLLTPVILLAGVGVIAGCAAKATDVPLLTIATTVMPSEQVIASPTVQATLPPAIPATSIPTAIPATETPASVAALPLAGVEVHDLSQVNWLENSGVYWVRRNALKWHQIEREPGARQWEAATDLEQELQFIAAQGMEAILIIRGTPDWASKVPGSDCGPILPEHLPAFADFVHAAVVRYSAPPYRVKYWELGNEPDVDPAFIPPDWPFGCWGDQADADYGGGYYAEMLKEVYPAIKAADPEAQVLVGGLLLDCDPVNPPETQPGSGVRKDCQASRFLEGILKNGGGDFFDGVSFHAYDYYYGAEGKYGNPNWNGSWKESGPVFINKATYLRQLLEAYGYEDKALLNTEVALLCGQDGTAPECMTPEFDWTKAYYLAQSNSMALAAGLEANVWYSLAGWRGSALIDSNQAPLPAYQALLFNTSILSKATFHGIPPVYQGLRAYAFKRGSQQIWVIWSQDGNSYSVSLNAIPTAVYDVYGNPLMNALEIPIGLSPVYIVWEAQP